MNLTFESEQHLSIRNIICNDNKFILELSHSYNSFYKLNHTFFNYLVQLLLVTSLSDATNDKFTK